MRERRMHITMEILQEKELSWLPRRESGEEKKKCWIDLDGNTTPEEVDTILRVLSGYNSYPLNMELSKDEFLEQIYRQLDRKNLKLPGGIRFEGDGCHINPGCCSGLEDWLTVMWGLAGSNSPWMGHDPDVSFLEKDGVCYIADVKLVRYQTLQPFQRVYGSMAKVGLSEALRNEDIQIIQWQKEEFQRCLNEIDRDFKEFLEGPLLKRMEELTGGWGKGFARAFARCFRRTRINIKNREMIEDGNVLLGRKMQMKKEDKQKLEPALAPLRSLIGEQEFLELALIYIQREYNYAIYGIEHSEKNKLFLSCYEIRSAAGCGLMVLSAEKEPVDKTKFTASHPEYSWVHYFSYEDIDDLLLWIFRDGEDLMNMKKYRELARTVGKALSFLDEEKFGWWEVWDAAELDMECEIIEE